MRGADDRIGGMNESRSLYYLVEGGMSASVRLLIATYILIYRVLTPPIVASGSMDVSLPFLLRAVANGLMEFILIIPILFIRKVGYFHPLVFPVLYSIAFAVAFQPIHLLFPFVLASQPWFDISPSYSATLQQLDADSYIFIYTYYYLVSALFWICTYCGFYAVKFKTTPESKVHGSSSVVFGAQVYLVIAILLGWAFIMSRGGISAQILSFYSGRYQSMSGSGVYTVVTKVASVAILIWMVAAPKAERQPLFWIFFGALLPIYWLVDGSRSSVLLMIMSVIVVLSMKRGKIPVMACVSTAIAAIIIFGMLGMLRQNFNSTQVDYSAFNANRMSEWIEASDLETKKRAAEEGDLSSFANAVSGQYLYGKSYLSVLAYPIPRALWPNKPKNIFTYNNWVSFLGNSPDDPAPQIWGIPTNSISEAFWNFGLIGIVVVGLTVGIGLKFATDLFRSRPYEPWICVLFVEFLLYFNGGSRWALYLIQNLAGLLIIIMIAKISVQLTLALRNGSGSRHMRHPRIGN